MCAKLLILDDEVDMLSLLETIITGRTEHKVTASNNPLELEELMAANDFDLVITDLKMLGRDGLEVMERVHQKDNSIPVVIITAYGSLESAQEAVRKGAYDYITKPFRKEQVLLATERALEWRRMTLENRRLKGQG
ncbi:MAG: response regulator [Acidobacteria bacterium]|nr:response regulator [Acidobacteriota bacterium]